MSVCVLGAGVIGLSTAVAIQHRWPNVDVTIIADTFGSGTASHGAGGIVCPAAEGNPGEVGRRWCQDSMNYFLDLAFSTESKESGVSLVNGISLTNMEGIPPALRNLPNLHKIDIALLQRFGRRFQSGYSFTTALVDMSQYMEWLSNKFMLRGGKQIKRKIESIKELAYRHDAVLINCTGLGSHELVNDPLVYPMRGQNMRIVAPWCRLFLHSDENLHVFPFANEIYLGGVKQPHSTDTTVSEKDRDAIVQNATEIFAPLKGAKIVSEWVGFRPVRKSVRLELDDIPLQSRKPMKIIHNYGHGSLGVSLSWGCAMHVVRLMEDQQLFTQPKSKL